jgi:hypothetical protein
MDGGPGKGRRAAQMRHAALQARMAQETSGCAPADREQLKMLAQWFEEQAKTPNTEGR